MKIKKNIILYRFHKRDHKEGESANEYLEHLRKLSKYCEFNAFLINALRDKIVCGLRNVHIQKRLLSESELTLTKTAKIRVDSKGLGRQILFNSCVS
jgi:hypothetical protein